ncbi:MAG TPA: sulfatase-like hydrolase/transferase [Lacipirellulaceae bacterium]|nr:sulfatase-like hydrolase/transferase [Lacipirellulaceae bacterium]
MPNIVYILADDMGLGDVRGYTPTSAIDTPNIDRLASGGMMFTNAHTSDSVCTPSRYALLTGQYAWRGASLQGALQPFSPPITDPNRLTVAEMLQASGYSTAMFGKWHLGLGYSTTNGAPAAINGSNVDFSKPITGGPADRGFDTFLGIDGSANYPPYAFINGRYTVGSDLVTPAVPTGQVSGNPANFAINLPGPIADGFDTTKTLQTLTTATTNYISSKANQGQPFFTYFAMNAPHAPITPAPGLDSGYRGPNAPYANFVYSVDQAVGQVLDTINDPNHDGDTSDSIANNTLVVFTADNGAADLFAMPNSAGNINGVPMRGSKDTIYEGGTRVPFLAQWGGHIPAGTVNNHIVALNDFTATAATLTGYTLPTSGAAEDSINILPELLGTATKSVRSVNVEHSTGGTFAIHQVDSAGTEWKLIFSSGDGTTSANNYDPTVGITDFTRVQLYNLTSDPGEQTNLLSGGGARKNQRKALQLQRYMQSYIYTGRSAGIKPETLVQGSATELGTTTMLVDFGVNTQQTTQAGVTWNNFTGTPYSDPTITKGVYDQGGGYTGIVMKSQFVNGGVATGVQDPSLNYDGPYPNELAGIPSDALRDGFYISDGSSLVITMSALDPHATYDFQFFSAAKVFMSYTLFTVAGANSGQDHIAPVNKNATQVATVNGIAADNFGTITITVEGRQPDGSLQDPNVPYDAAGQINFMRIVQHLQIIPGDYNGDRIVDSADYAVWRAAVGATGVNPADGNNDGIVDGADYLIWRHAVDGPDFGSGSGQQQVLSPLTTQAVPEPTVLTLLGMAAACGWGSIRRRD